MQKLHTTKKYLYTFKSLLLTLFVSSLITPVVTSAEYVSEKDKARASEAPTYLSYIAMAEEANYAEVNEYISAANHKELYDSLGVDIPKNTYFSYSVQASSYDYVVTATLKAPLGGIPAGATITVNSDGDRFATKGLHKLVPSYVGSEFTMYQKVAYEAPTMLSQICAAEEANYAEVDEYISAANQRELLRNLGIEIPKTSYFTYTVIASKENFLAIATLKEPLGDIPAGAVISVNNYGYKSANKGLAPLVLRYLE